MKKLSEGEIFLQAIEEENLDAFRTKYQALAAAARAELGLGNQDTGTPEP